MKFITYVILIFVISIIAAVLNLVEGIYFGLAVPALNSVNVSVKMPSNPIPFASNIVDVLVLLIGMIIFMILIYIVKILREGNPYGQ